MRWMNWKRLGARQSRQRRAVSQLLLEPLESRRLLAVDGWTINLNGGLGPGLLGASSGGSVQSNFAQQASGGSLNATNRPGWNNTPPVAIADYFLTSEKAWFTGNVLVANGTVQADYDPDGDRLAIRDLADPVGKLSEVVTLPSGAAVVMQPDGAFVYWPSPAFGSLAADQIALDQFAYRLVDGRGGVAAGTVVISIQGVNDAPAANPDFWSLAANASATGLTNHLLANDTDPDAGETQRLSIVAVDTSQTLGSVTLVNGQLYYDPNGQFQPLTTGQSALDTFTYTIADAHGAMATATATITIWGVDDPATRIALNPFLLRSYSSLDAMVGTLSTDDPDTTDITFLLASGLGDLDNSFFRIEGDQLLVDRQLGQGPWSIRVRAEDGRGHTLEQVIFIEASSARNGLQLDLDGDDSSGSLDNNFAITWIESSIYQAGTGPVAVADSDIVLSDRHGVGTTVQSMIVVMSNARPNDVLNWPGLPVGLNLESATIAGQPAWIVTGTADHATYVHVIGSLTFDIAGDLVDTTARTVVFLLDDGDALSEPSMATISVRQANQPVTIDLDLDDSSGRSGNDFAVTFIEAGLSVTGTGPVNVADWDVGLSDLDGDDTFELLRVTITDSVSSEHEILAIDTTGLSGSFVTHWDGATLTVTGTNSLADWTTALQRITYNNSAERFAALTRTIRFVAVQDSVAGPASYTLVTIVASRDGIVAQDDTLVLNEDDSQVDVSSQLLINDRAIDTDDNLGLTITAIDTTGSLGVVTLIEGVVYYAAAGHFDYLNTGQWAEDYFTYTIRDAWGETASATVTVVVWGINDAPVAGSYHFHFDEDSQPMSLTGPLLSSSSDPDHDTLEIVGYAQWSGAGLITLDGGDLVFDPGTIYACLAWGESVDETLIYTIADGQLATATQTITITVHGRNDAPTDLALSTQLVDPTADVGTNVGTFTAIDIDNGATLSYQLVAGEGDSDNNYFVIVDEAGDPTLRIQSPLPYQSQFAIRVRVYDEHGDGQEQAFVLLADYGLMV